MKFRKLASVFMVSALFLTGCQSTSGKSQKEETTEKKPSVVAATVSGAQVLDKLDANVVGVPTTKMTLPEKLKGLPEVGQAMSPDLEIVASLEPDVFVMDNMFKEKVEESMKKYDLDTFYFDTSTYTNFLTSIEKLGAKIGQEKEATKVINELKDVEKEAVKNKKGEAPKVAIIFGGGENFMLATESSYLGDLVKTVGAKNITNNLDTSVKSPYIQFSLEQILEQDPDYILRFAHGEIEQTKKAFDSAFDKNPAYKELDAVKNNKVIDLDPSIFNVSANLQVKEAIKTLGETFYGK
ncbi:ABC transporter substrate-binding protein [[Clostridium] sordellii]|uniref:Iron chelate uptake ABC transporter, solute-binding protein n=1 Tax=Paraclostridium sordellii TaxID=1505 RepID=A0ABM9RLG9_PARSO|nr:ABC transporter substrate-binding protein [Paeniclostridium sordellii]CEJ72856.1 putative iron chelate uptake ABC transporter, solute-binding protein [[Clostridium] sordellii] [Paeniclostridium sordellii]CEN68409.1 ABC transporter substrate-binding protein [[Clostridium] sordellii] [Paeniclostridium sordellii]CEN71676.1 ABC transporter substrate-binding protein [[Clostridium] sordellii] [Paeniclostridium sordellii]CEO22094.1 ABC transporter substrate-binding protein [[Clostridium] sordellii]